MTEPPQTAHDLPSSISERIPSTGKNIGVVRNAMSGMELTLTILGGLILGGVVFPLLIAVFDRSIADPDIETSDGAALAQQFGLVVGMLAVAIYATRLTNDASLLETFRRMGFRKPNKSFFAAIPMAIGIYLLIAIAVNLIFEPQQEDIAENLGADENSALGLTILAGIVIIAGAALWEEIVFRGLLFGVLRKRFSLWPAAVISGAIFGSLHLTAGDIGVAIQLSGLGVAMAWLYERTGSLWAPVMLHAANNTLAFFILIS